MKTRDLFHILMLSALAACAAPAAPAGGAGSRAADGAWMEAMKKVHAGFQGTPGHVAQFGDSITYSMAFWAPLGWSDPDAFLTGNDGLPKRPDQRWRDVIKGVRVKGGDNGSYSGWTVHSLLNVVPKILARDKPEVAIVMIGTNDTTKDGPPEDYGANLRRVLAMTVDAHCIPVLNTIPPKRDQADGVEKTNRIIREVAAELKIPLVDYHAEILKRQPGDAWLGTLISDDGVHPSGGEVGDFSPANLSKCGYALRTWVNFLKFREIYFRILKP